MKKNLQNPNAVIAPATSGRASIAPKSMPLSKNAVWARVFILFLLLGFWRTGGAQSVFDATGAAGVIGDVPVEITVSPLGNLALEVNGQVRFNSLLSITGGTAFLSLTGMNNLVYQTGSLPSIGAFGQTLYWDISTPSPNWEPTSFLFVDPGNIVSIGTPIGTPVSGAYESDPSQGMLGVPFGWDNSSAPYGPASPYLSVGGGDIECDQNLFLLGNAYIGSDRSLKTNISELSNWRRILNLQAYSYNYIGKEDAPLSYGFMAQDVYSVLPEFTATWRGKGAVNYIGFIPFLTQGIQEHEAEIEKLKIENEQLKSKNEQLESRLAALENFVYNQQGKTTSAAR